MHSFGHNDAFVNTKYQIRRRFPNLAAPLGCGHGIEVCQDCVLRFVAASLQSHGQWDRVSCIECKGPATKEEIMGMVASKDFAKYARKTILRIKNSADLGFRLEIIVEQKAIEANPRFRSCLSARCDHGQVHTNTSDDCVECEACGAASCFNHGVPWHKGYTCDAYDAMHPDAISLRTSEERIESIAKRCPGKGCKFYVEKDGGCGHMYCPQCREGWDWETRKLDRELYQHGLNGPPNGVMD